MIYDLYIIITHSIFYIIITIAYVLLLNIDSYPTIAY